MGLFGCQANLVARLPRARYFMFGCLLKALSLALLMQSGCPNQACWERPDRASPRSQAWLNFGPASARLLACPPVTPNLRCPAAGAPWRSYPTRPAARPRGGAPPHGKNLLTSMLRHRLHGARHRRLPHAMELQRGMWLVLDHDSKGVLLVAFLMSLVLEQQVHLVTIGID